LQGILLLALISINASCGDNTVPRATDADSQVNPALKIPANAKKVIFLGDSISAGLHLDDPQEESFPALIQKELAQLGQPFHLVNAGVSGDTSAGGLRRLSWMLAQDPDVLVIELGANDGLRGAPLKSIEDNLRGIIRGARKDSVKVLLLGHRLPPNLGKSYTMGFADIFDRLAKEEDIACVPFFMEGVAGDPDLNFPDGIHPTAPGHLKLASNVAGAVARLLKP